MVAIEDSLSDLASSNDWEDGEDEDDEEPEQGKLSKDDKPGRVMGTISNTGHHRMERFRHKQMKLDKLTHPGWGDTADYFCERDKKYSTSELRVPAVVKPRTNEDAAALAPTTFMGHMGCLDIVLGILQIPRGTPRPGSRQIRVSSGKPQSNTVVASHAPAVEPESPPIEKAKHVYRVSFEPGI